ncbi:MAG: hypothetical protein J5641_07160 [Bacteroidales bacterium]|nr:hypothetical protein [Bacteroidales bacterium]
MKKFLLNIGIFIVVAGLLGAGLDWAITKGLHKRTDYVQEVWNDVMDTTVQPDVVVLGNCVATHDHNPAILDSVLGADSYVFAMSNLTFPYHNFMWNMLRKYHKQDPKLVVLALDYSDMSYRDAKTNMENEQFLALMHDRDARRFLRQYGGYSWLDAYVPCYRYFGHHKRIKYGIYNFLGLKKYAGSPEHYKGYQGLDAPYNAHREWFDGNFVQPIEPEVVEMLDGFLCDCNKSGIEVLMVLPPIVYELSDRVENEEEVYHVYDSLAQAHGFDCIRYVKPHWMSMDTNHFEGPNHLNKQMSDVYTLDLANYIAGKR